MVNTCRPGHVHTRQNTLAVETLVYIFHNSWTNVHLPTIFILAELLCKAATLLMFFSGRTTICHSFVQSNNNKLLLLSFVCHRIFYSYAHIQSTYRATRSNSHPSHIVLAGWIHSCPMTLSSLLLCCPLPHPLPSHSISWWPGAVTMVTM